MHPRLGCTPRLSFWGWIGRARSVSAVFGAVANRPLHGPSRGGRARSIAAVLGIGLTALVFCGCQSTQERSAELARQAKHEVLASQGASVTKESPNVKVLQSTVVRSSSGTAVVVALRNSSTHTLENAPIEVTVHDAHGSVLYQNNAPGLEPSLTTVSLLLPGQETIWVDDQVTASGTPATATALVGEGTQASGSVPQQSISGTHLSAEAALSGGVANHSQTAQQNLVVYAVARRGVKIVAAGRAVLPEVPTTGTNVAFQIYFVGDPSNAQISTSAPATTF
jgi:hypothetical protein